MEFITGIDWAEMFTPDKPFLEIFFRGTFVYLMIFAMFRFILKRGPGEVGITDLLVLVLIADASQNAMSADYNSLTDGFFLVATIIFWNYFLDWLSYRFPKIRRIIVAPALPLVKNGRIQKQNLRKQFITEEELWSHLREEGVDKVSEVKLACMESDGHISVVPYKK